MNSLYISTNEAVTLQSWSVSRCSRSKMCSVSGGYFEAPLVHAFVQLVAHHREGLAAARRAVREDAALVAVDRVVHYVSRAQPEYLLH